MNQPTQTVHATAHFPVIHPPGTVEDQRKKLLEEIDEFVIELSHNDSYDQMAAELNDIYQAFVTLCYMRHKELGVMVDFEIDYHVTEFIEDANKEHRAKIERYKAERKWT